MKKNIIKQNGMLKYFCLYNFNLAPYIGKMHFEKKKCFTKIERKYLQCFYHGNSLSDYQGFLGELFKIITYYRIDRFVKLN